MSWGRLASTWNKSPLMPGTRKTEAGVLRAGTTPGLPDFLACLLQHCLVRGVLPQHELLDDAEAPLALPLLSALGGGNRSGLADGSSTIWAKITARAAASGRRAHHRCSVLGCPCRIDFSRFDALLMASSGRATSISFFLVTTGIIWVSCPFQSTLQRSATVDQHCLCLAITQPDLGCPEGLAVGLADPLPVH